MSSYSPAPSSASSDSGSNYSNTASSTATSVSSRGSITSEVLRQPQLAKSTKLEKHSTALPLALRGRRILNCDNCRVRKSRCDREKPGCADCKNRNVECSYAGSTPTISKPIRRAKPIKTDVKDPIVAKPTSPIRKGTIVDDLVDIFPFHADNLQQLQDQLRAQENAAIASPHLPVPPRVESDKKKDPSSSSNVVEEKKRKSAEVEHRVSEVEKDRKRVCVENDPEQGPTQPKKPFPSVLILPPTARSTLAPSPIILDRPRVTSLALPSHNTSPNLSHQSRPFPIRFHSDPVTLQSTGRLSFALDEKLKRNLIDGPPPRTNAGEQRREFAIDSVPPPRRPSISHLPYNRGRLGRSMSGPVRMVAGGESTAGEERRRASLKPPAALPWTTARVVVNRKSSVSYIPLTPPHDQTTFYPQSTFSPRTEEILDRPLPLEIPAPTPQMLSFDYPSPTTPTSYGQQGFPTQTQSKSEHSFHHSYEPIQPPVSRRADSYPGTMTRVRGLPLLNSPRFYFQLRQGILPREGLPSIGNWYDRSG